MREITITSGKIVKPDNCVTIGVFGQYFSYQSKKIKKPAKATNKNIKQDTETKENMTNYNVETKMATFKKKLTPLITNLVTDDHECSEEYLNKFYAWQGEMRSAKEKIVNEKSYFFYEQIQGKLCKNIPPEMFKEGYIEEQKELFGQGSNDSLSWL